MYRYLRSPPDVSKSRVCSQRWVVSHYSQTNVLWLPHISDDSSVTTENGCVFCFTLRLLAFVQFCLNCLPELLFQKLYLETPAFERIFHVLHGYSTFHEVTRARSNEKVLGWMDVERQLLQTIKRRRIICFGHKISTTCRISSKARWFDAEAFNEKHDDRIQ